MNILEYQQALSNFTQSDEFGSLNEQDKQDRILNFRNTYISENPDAPVENVDSVTESINKNFLRTTGRGRVVPSLDNIIFPNQERGFEQLTQDQKLEKIEEFKAKIPSLAGENPHQKEDTEFFLNQSMRELERRVNGENVGWIRSKGAGLGEGFFATLAEFVGATDTADNIRDFFHENPKYDEDFTQQLSQGFGSGFASIAIVAGLAMTTKGLGGSAALSANVGTAGSLTANAILRYNEAYKNAINAGLDEDKASESGIAALPAAVIDVVGDKILAAKLMPKGAEKIFITGSKAEKAAMIASLAQNSTYKSKLIEYASAAAGEGLAEAAGDYVAAIGPYYRTGEDRYIPDVSESVRSFMLGAVIGGGMTTTFDLPDVIGDKKGIKRGDQPAPNYQSKTERDLSETALNLEEIAEDKSQPIYDLLSKGQYRDAFVLSNKMMAQQKVAAEKSSELKEATDLEAEIDNEKNNIIEADFEPNIPENLVVKNEQTQEQQDSTEANQAVPPEQKKEKQINPEPVKDTEEVRQQRIDAVKQIKSLVTKAPKSHGVMPPDGPFDPARPFVVLNIKGVDIPFYRSSKGTSGKQQGGWFPFFGISNKGGKKWMIKGSLKDNENGYGIPEIQQAQQLLNQATQGNDEIWSEELLKMNLGEDSAYEAYYEPNEEIFGVKDIDVNSKNAKQHIQSVLSKMQIPSASKIDKKIKSEKAKAAKAEAEKKKESIRKSIHQDTKKSVESTQELDATNESNDAVEYLSGLKYNGETLDVINNIISDIRIKNPSLRIVYNKDLAGKGPNGETIPVQGLYNSNNNTLYLRVNTIRVIAHEVAHALTLHDIYKYVNAQPGATYREKLANAKEDSNVPEYIKDLIDVYVHAANEANKAYVVGRIITSSNLADSSWMTSIEYAFTSLHEFVAEAMSYEKFQQILANIPYQGTKTLWDRMVEIIGSAWKWVSSIANPDKILRADPNNTLDITLGIIRQIIDNGNNFERYVGIKNNIAPLPLDDLDLQFKNITSTIPDNPTKNDLDEWKKSNPEEYNKLLNMKENVLRGQGYNIEVWHGSREKDLKILDPKNVKPSQRTDSGRYGWDATYLSTEKEAEGYGSTKYKFFVKIKNPFLINKGEDFYEKLESLIPGATKAILGGDNFAGDYVARLGFDGVYEPSAEYQESERPIYAVYNSSQVKSAEPLNIDDNGKLILPSKWGDSSESGIAYLPQNPLENHPDLGVGIGHGINDGTIEYSVLESSQRLQRGYPENYATITVSSNDKIKDVASNTIGIRSAVYEHIGDLHHRAGSEYAGYMDEKNDRYAYKYLDMNNGYVSLATAQLEKSIAAQEEGTAKYYNKPVEEVKKNAELIDLTFAAIYSRLQAFTPLQAVGRNMAIAFGLQRYGLYLNLSKTLNDFFRKVESLGISASEYYKFGFNIDGVNNLSRSNNQLESQWNTNVKLIEAVADGENIDIKTIKHNLITQLTHDDMMEAKKSLQHIIDNIDDYRQKNNISFLPMNGDFEWDIAPFDKETNTVNFKHKLPNNSIISVDAFKRIAGNNNRQLSNTEIDSMRILAPEAFDGDNVNVNSLYKLLSEREPVKKVVYGFEGVVSNEKLEYDKLTHEYENTKNGIPIFVFDGRKENPQEESVINYYKNGITTTINNPSTEDLEKALKFERLSIKLSNVFNTNKGPTATEFYKTGVTDINLKDLQKAGGNFFRVDVVAVGHEMTDEEKLLRYKNDLKEGKREKFTEQEINERLSVNDWNYMQEFFGVPNEEPYKKKIFWQQDNLHESLPDTLGWAAVNLLTPEFISKWSPDFYQKNGIPEGENVLLVRELQSRWGQVMSKLKKEVKTNPNKFNIERVKSDDHPLLSAQLNLVLKSVVSEAKKLGINNIILPDAETVMMTEGHDVVDRFWSPESDNDGNRKEPTVIYEVSKKDVKEEYGDISINKIEELLLKKAIPDIIDKGEKIHNGLFHNQKSDTERDVYSMGWSVNSDKYIIEKWTETRPAINKMPAQSKGMSLHYDTTASSVMSKIIGKQGTEVELGIHENAKEGSPVFRDENGNPKTKVTGTLYNIHDVNADKKPSIASPAYLPAQTRSQEMRANYHRLRTIQEGQLNDKYDANTQKIVSILRRIKSSDVAKLDKDIQDIFFDFVTNVYNSRKSGQPDPEMRIGVDDVIEQLEKIENTINADAVAKMLERYDDLIDWDNVDINLESRKEVEDYINEFVEKNQLEDFVKKQARSQKAKERLEEIYDKWRGEFYAVRDGVLARYGDSTNYVNEVESTLGAPIATPELRSFLEAHFEYITKVVDISELSGKDLYDVFFAANNMVDGSFRFSPTIKYIANLRNQEENISSLQGTFRDPVMRNSKILQAYDEMNRFAELHQTQLQRHSSIEETRDWLQNQFMIHLYDAIMRTSNNRTIAYTEEFISFRNDILQGLDRETDLEGNILMNTEDRIAIAIMGRLVQFELGENPDIALKRNIKKELQSINNIIENSKNPDNVKLHKTRVLALFNEMTEGLSEYGPGSMAHLMDTMESRISGTEDINVGIARKAILEKTQEIFSRFGTESQIISEGFHKQPLKRIVHYVTNDVYREDFNGVEESITDPITLEVHKNTPGLRNKSGHFMERASGLTGSDSYSYNIEGILFRNIQRLAVDNATIAERFIISKRLEKGSELNNIISTAEDGSLHYERVHDLKTLAYNIVQNATAKGEPLNWATSTARALTSLYAKPMLSSIHHIVSQPTAACVDYAIRTGNIGGWFKAALYYASHASEVNQWLKDNQRWTSDRIATETLAIDQRRSPIDDQQSKAFLNSPFIRTLEKYYKGAGKIMTFFIHNGDNFASRVTVLAEYERMLKEKGYNFENFSDINLGATEGRILTAATLNAERNINTSNKILRGELFTDRRNSTTLIRNLLFAFSAHTSSLASQMNQAVRDLAELRAIGATEGQVEAKIRTIAAITMQQICFTTARFMIGAISAKMMIGLVSDLFDDEEGKIEELETKLTIAREKRDPIKIANAEHELANAKSVRKAIIKMKHNTQSADSLFKQMLRDGTGAFSLIFNNSAAQKFMFVVPDKWMEHIAKESRDEIIKDYQEQIKSAKDKGNNRLAAKLSEQKTVMEASEYIPISYSNPAGFGVTGLYGSIIDSYGKIINEANQAAMGVNEYNLNDLIISAFTAGVGQSEMNKLMNYIDRIEDEQWKSNKQFTEETLPGAIKRKKEQKPKLSLPQVRIPRLEGVNPNSLR